MALVYVLSSSDDKAFVKVINRRSINIKKIFIAFNLMAVELISV